MATAATGLNAVFAFRAVSLITAAALAACGPSCDRTASKPASDLSSEPVLASLPLAELAGAARDPAGLTVTNPFEGDSKAVADGHRLFIAMNCAGCHGYDAAGNMGPNLTDRAWRYGGTPLAIYQSISQGRPQGMPSWGQALPPQDIWKLVAFVQSFGGAYPPGGHEDWLNGDHDVTSVAPEVTTLVPAFNLPALRNLGTGPEKPVAGGTPAQVPEGGP
jgi:cytochrome c oxidase cbb3-type subunit III